MNLLRNRTNQALLDGRVWILDMPLHSIAPYAQGNFQIKDQIMIKAGIHYDAIFLHVDDYQTLPYSPKQDEHYNPSVAVTGGTMIFDRLSFNLGIRYIANQNFIPYFSFSQGFSLLDIGQILRETDNLEIIQKLAVKAFFTDNYVIGSLIFFNRLRIEISVYYNKSNMGNALAFNDKQNRFEQTSTPQHIFGAELSADARFLNEKLLHGGSFSWTKGLTQSDKDNKSLIYVRGMLSLLLN